MGWNERKMATPIHTNTFVLYSEIGGQLITIDAAIQRAENKRHRHGGTYL